MSSTPRVFITGTPFCGDTVRISGSDAHHILNVLRLRRGEKILVCDMKRTEFDGTITEISDGELSVILSGSRQSSSEFPFSVNLYQGVPKGDKLDTIVQKAVELGVTSVIPVICERSVSKPDEKAFAKKIERLNRIAASASSQCGRGILPKVLPPLSFSNACKEMKCSEISFICYEGDGTVPIKTFLCEKKPGSISFLIGPEGGLSAGEVNTAIAHDIPIVGLGNRILRTETAGSFVLSAISVLIE
ncbi:MAG: 16S rRNA (uracil(1498)-N(3))-methyltransferase [Eubacteriales bacterium]|nr:16S rRNA (uracil(1498)-N(3))-methyltransferase [Eubacteriales bacterium]MDD4421638.1 16S rRNA (uracil(1498)-N(3))-methyltransferase [Eubacteriales bacterium]HBR30952.1 16S rRNA (uracil(1498)-N(3))-methyltransferase [Clostridiales bacterium]